MSSVRELSDEDNGRWSPNVVNRLRLDINTVGYWFSSQQDKGSHMKRSSWVHLLRTKRWIRTVVEPCSRTKMPSAGFRFSVVA